MSDSPNPITELLRRDKRYAFDAYVFVFEALRYAQEELNMGVDVGHDAVEHAASGEELESWSEESLSATSPHHLTGQELCEAIRQYALEQYGYMAKCVFNQWGVNRTIDFGEIVFNLIEIGEMRKTDEDRREDFEDVFDFDEGLTRRFKITKPE